MAQVKRRTVTITTGGASIYQGAGLLVAAVFNHHASSSSNVVTIYDSSAAETAVQLFTRSSDTDAGTTVPVTCYTDGDLPAGTSTANVKAGIPFSRGLYLTKTGDTTHEDVYDFIIIPLIRKSVQVRTTGADGSGVGNTSVFNGPGILHGIRIKSDSLNPTTTDFLVKDSPIGAAGNQLLIKTDYGQAALATRPTVTLTGVDEGGTAVSTAATGAYASIGIAFLLGLNVAVTGANAQDRVFDFEFLIEA